MRELIEYAISMDGMITLKRTLYIMDMVEAESEYELGTPLNRETIKFLYIANNSGELTELEACCARLLIEEYERKFTDDLLRLVMKHGAEEAGRIYGSSGDFAREILAYFEANGGTVVEIMLSIPRKEKYF